MWPLNGIQNAPNNGKRIPYLVATIIALLAVSTVFWYTKVYLESTPTPPPDNYLKLDLLKVWFQHQDMSSGRGHKGAVSLVLKQEGGVIFEKAFPLDENGEVRDAELPGVETGTYDAFIYTPGYLTKKLAGVVMGEGDNILDFTKGGTEYFLFGDFNGDQEINALDFSIFAKSYSETGEDLKVF